MLTGERQNFVADVDCGIMLAAVQRVLSPGAQEPFHCETSDAQYPEIKRDIWHRDRRIEQVPAGSFGA
jgi:hypothetical protein